MKDITIGQYYPTNSIIHKLDPRVKLFCTLVFIISLFLINNFIGYIFFVIILGVIIKTSRIPFGMLLKGLKGILIILLLSVSLNLFMTDGQIVFRIWFLKVTIEGIIRAAFLGFRLILLIIGTSILTLSTSPNDLADGLEKAFRPLNKIKIPIHEISMMMSIALRFIPILMEETDKIMKAQKSRGADFDSKGLIKKIKAFIPLLVPLFISAIRRAMDLAMAMEARCYRGGEGRTKMKPLIYKKRDKLTYVFAFVYLFIIIIGDKILNNIALFNVLKV